QYRHAGLGRYAAVRQSRPRHRRDQEHRRRHRQAGDRLRPHGLRDGPGVGEVPERGRISVPARPAVGDPRARRARILRRAGGEKRSAVLRPANGGAKTLKGAAWEVALAQQGLTLPKPAMARTPSEAATAAARVGFPVALKIVSSAISHKTEVGGVRLHLTSEAEVERAAHALADTVAKAGAALDGYLVQEMVEGIEMIVGAYSDPLYGPMTVVGAGGILVELVEDVAFRLLPVTPEDARAMIAELKVAKLLAGFRGRPQADVDALVRAICGLSALYL